MHTPFSASKLNNIYTYMSFNFFGTGAPSESDKLTKGRSNSIEYAKKSYIPNRLLKWYLQSYCGNPNKSEKVNELI